MRKMVYAGLMCLALALKPFIAAAGEVDILVDKLVEKGVLTPVEARIILDETKMEVAKQNARAENTAIPEWVQRITFKGDVRVRGQRDDMEGSVERDRGRVRLRFGADAMVTDTVKAMFGIATGSADPRSTNVTFENTFEKPDIRLDYAMGQWSPETWFTLMAGRMQLKPVIWTASDMLWDSDICPTGAAIALNGNVNADFKVFLNANAFMIEELSGSTADPYMMTVQPGFEVAMGDAFLKGAVACYFFQDVEGASLDHSSASNSATVTTTPATATTAAVTTRKYLYDYDSYNPGVEFGLRNISDILPYAGIFADYVMNPDPDDNNKGYIAGIRFGHEAVKAGRQWKASASYRELEKDAWIDVFPDSDFYNGKTNTKGYEFSIDYGLTKNSWMTFDYYTCDVLDGVSKKLELYQLDWNLKF